MTDAEREQLQTEIETAAAALWRSRGHGDGEWDHQRVALREIAAQRAPEHVARIVETFDGLRVRLSPRVKRGL